jgi:colicin import membrane protein
MARTPLKVFVTQIGLHEVIVAAPSQRAALAAWGIERNLFVTGRAHDTREPDVCAVALAAPGQVFARPAGSAKPFRTVTGPLETERAAIREDDGPQGGGLS